MKKIQLSMILSVLWFVSYGQFDNTSFVLGGTADYSYDDNSSTKSSSFSVWPTIAKPIGNKVLVGLEFGFGVNNSRSGENDPMYKSNGSNYSPGVFYQRFYAISDKLFFNWRAKANVNFVKSVTEDNVGKYTEHSTAYTLQASPGISWKVMDRILLNGSIGGASFGFYDNAQSNVTLFSLYFNNPQFGFSFLLK